MLDALNVEIQQTYGPTIIFIQVLILGVLVFAFCRPSHGRHKERRGEQVRTIVPRGDREEVPDTRTEPLSLGQAVRLPAWAAGTDGPGHGPATGDIWEHRPVRPGPSLGVAGGARENLGASRRRPYATVS